MALSGRELVVKVCETLIRFGHQPYILKFQQSLPHAETSVSIHLTPKDGKYYVEVANSRSDTVINSSSITEVFKDRLPNMVGYIEVNKLELNGILTDLIMAKTHFTGTYIFVKHDYMIETKFRHPGLDEFHIRYTN